MINFIQEYKECNRCGNIYKKTLTYFYRDKHKKDGLSTLCKKCKNKTAHKWTDENPDKAKECYTRYRERNKEKRKQSNRIYIKKNKEKIKERSKKYLKENPGKRKETVHKYKINNRIKSRIDAQKRRSIMSNLISNYTEEEWQECKKYFNNTCAYCGKKSDNLQQEHFIPLIKGGEYTKDNILPSCQHCNCSKLDRDFFEWYPKYEFFSKERLNKIIKYLGISVPLNVELS